MRRFAPTRALARGSLLTLALSSAAPTLAQDAVPTAPRAEASTTSTFSSAPEAPASAQTELSLADRVEKRRRQLLRRANTYYGAVGGIHVVEAGSGAPQSFRFQLITDFFFKNNYLDHHDKTRYVGGALSLSVTPVEHLEISASASTANLRSRRPADPLEPFGDTSTTLQVIGNPYVDVKTYGEVARGVTLGADVSVQILTRSNTDAIKYAGTTGGFRGNLSLDLREMRAHSPLELRFNAGYVYDQSRKIVSHLERNRLTTLQNAGITRDTTGRDEFRQLALRSERLAYNINRVDQATLAFGLEAPLELSERVALHPIAEWELWIPVNRQNYDCSRAVLPSGQKIPGQDSCLADENASVWQQRVTLGARLYPALPGFNLLAAVEIGVGGSKTFVRELAPTPPYRVILAASYAVDPRSKPKVVVVKAVEKRVEVTVAPIEGRIRGVVREQGTGLPVPGVKVTFPGRGLSPLVADAQGQFVTYAFGPGYVPMELDVEGYRPGGCSGTIPNQGGDSQLVCELVALPRVGSLSGRVVDVNGAPVPGATVNVSGAAQRQPVTDADGRFHEVDLPAGDYQARVEQAGFLISIAPAQVEVRKDAQLQLQLVPKPKLSSVKIVKDRLQLKGTIFFNNDTAELQKRSEPLLSEVADTLLRNPALLRLEVQGHTDNAGAPEYNRDLSVKRAEAVRDWLVRAGVAADRLVAQGYGSEKPIAPNINKTGRAKNRRVEFHITERSAAQ